MSLLQAPQLQDTCPPNPGKQVWHSLGNMLFQQPSEDLLLDPVIWGVLVIISGGTLQLHEPPFLKSEGRLHLMVNYEVQHQRKGAQSILILQDHDPLF